MSKLNTQETGRLAELIQTVTRIHDDNDKIMCGDDDLLDGVREVPTPSREVVLECHYVAQMLRSRAVNSPRLAGFLSDPSPFVVEGLAAELRNIKQEYGQR